MLSWHNPTAVLAHFQKPRYSLSKLSWTAFGGHLGSFWLDLDPKMETKISKKGSPNKSIILGYFLEQFWDLFGAHFGTKST